MSKEYISFIDPGGVEHDLSGSANIDIALGATGRFMPQFDITEQQVPFVPGSRLRNIAVKAREVDLPIEITALSTSDLRNVLRTTLNWFNPLKGDGQLKVIAEDGTTRVLNCRYQSGLEVQETGMTWIKSSLVLKAYDPYWYDLNPTITTYTTGTPPTFFPMFPMKLTSSTVFSGATVTNNGDVETWPIWIIKGPGDTIYLNNLTTGASLNINYSLGIGEYITIDTRPGFKTVTKNDGTNLFSYLSNTSSLWDLIAGANQIQIQMQNATTQSAVQLSYTNRYWGA